MVCIYCGSGTKVSNSRARSGNLLVWRRRNCLGCRAKFTTKEQIDNQSAIIIQKSSGALEPFQRDKLLISIYACLKHRKSAIPDATALTDTIIHLLIPKMKAGKLQANDIISTSSKTIARFDESASVSYLAYHPKKTK